MLAWTKSFKDELEKIALQGGSDVDDYSAMGILTKVLFHIEDEKKEHPGYTTQTYEVQTHDTHIV
jgi:hypothetical protein